MDARGLASGLRPGLRALGAESKRVSVGKPRRATESIALDEMLKGRHPGAARWDYGIGLLHGKRAEIAWVEVHTATSGEVDTVLKKLLWLKDWLAAGGDVCKVTPGRFCWVATDAGVHIDTARRRRLNAAGLAMPRSHLQL